MSNYIDEKIIPLKLEHCGNEDVSLKEGYFIDGKLEIFIKKKDGDGYNTAYFYTEAGDIKSIIYNDGKSVEYTYNSLRQLSQVKDALGTKNIEGDKFGRATKVVDYSKDEVSWKVW
jgi:YD repeat-containing protein